MWTHGLISTRHDTAQKKTLGFKMAKKIKQQNLGDSEHFPPTNMVKLETVVYKTINQRTLRRCHNPVSQNIPLGKKPVAKHDEYPGGKFTTRVINYGDMRERA